MMKKKINQTQSVRVSMISTQMGDHNKLQNCGSVVILRLSGLLQIELEALHGRKDYGRVCLWMTVNVIG